MPEKRNGRIIETATEVRQAEPGPSILFFLLVSGLSVAILILGGVWYVFFRT